MYSHTTGTWKCWTLPPFRDSYVREFELSHSNRVNRIIKITHAHDLHVKMLVFVRGRRANAHLLVFSSGLTPGRVKFSWIEIQSPSQPSYSSERLLRVLKSGKTSNRAVENLPQRKLEQRTMHSLTHRTAPCFYLSCSWRNALWLNAMHCGKKWWIPEFVAPYIFPLNPDYVAARSLRSLSSN